jgi:hypothetical protein
MLGITRSGRVERRWIKGDRSLRFDPPVAGDEILGVAFGIERRGRVISLTSVVARGAGVSLGVLTAALGLLGSRVWPRRRKQATAPG